MSARRDLWTADDAEHSYRSVRRLLCAGTCFNVVPGSTKAQCLKDFETLLGCFWNVTEFPLKGGRQFISGKPQLDAFLCVQVDQDSNAKK